MYNDVERAYLLRIAREAIIARLKGEDYTPPKPPSKKLLEKRAVFVTINKRGSLRGCIGYLSPVSSLVDAVIDNAINAAFEDPRFPPLSEDELKDLEIEISVLSPLREVSRDRFLDELKPFVHGVVLEKGLNRATFLPQVWEELPNVEEFMAHLCMKALLPANCWKDEDVKLYLYSVEKFSEGF